MWTELSNVMREIDHKTVESVCLSSSRNCDLGENVKIGVPLPFA